MLAECVELYQRLPTDVKISRASGSHVTKMTRERIITTFRAWFDERVRWGISFLPVNSKKFLAPCSEVTRTGDKHLRIFFFL